jgi:hypothetical protein
MVVFWTAISILFNLHHVFVFSIALIPSDSSSFLDSPCSRMTRSSAYAIADTASPPVVMSVRRLSITMSQKIGPQIDPWGHPFVMFLLLPHPDTARCSIGLGSNFSVYYIFISGNSCRAALQRELATTSC